MPLVSKSVKALFSPGIQINLSGAILAYDNSAPLRPWAVYGVSRLNDSFGILISRQDQLER